MSSFKIIKPYKASKLPVQFSSRNGIIKDEKSAFANLVKVDLQHIHHVEIEKNGRMLKCKYHPFIEAAHTAFYDHLPLVLTPDIIWYCISNAAAIYINKNSEEMRKTFVNHDGKKKLIIERPDFILGKQNPWNEAIEEFVDLIEANTNSDVVEKILGEFSTTTKISRIVSKIVAMDAMKQYFELTLKGGCGIPEIRVAGEKSDWERIKSKSLKLIEIIPKFEEWIPSVVEIIDEFINVFDDKIDNLFWKSIYHFDGGSGGKGLTGWMLALFPFIKSGFETTENEYCWNGKTWKDANVEGGLVEDNFDYHLNQVPFKFQFGDSDVTVDMLFVGGLVTVLIEDDFALTPIFGYGVVEDKIIPSRYEQLYRNRKLV